jgi:hypothetical protein
LYSTRDLFSFTLASILCLSVPSKPVTCIFRYFVIFSCFCPDISNK